MRLFDSRPGELGAVEKQPGNVDRAMPLPAGPGLAIQVAGIAGVPLDSTAVVLSVTATEATKPSYLTIHPGGARPNTSNLNFDAGEIAAQHVTATVGADDKVRIANADGTVHVIVDVAGWYGPTGSGGRPADARFTARSAPARAFDSRPGERGFSEPVDRVTALAPGEDLPLDLTGLGAVPASATAVVLNVTMTQGTASSYLSVYPGGSGASRPTASSINWRPGQTVANLVVAPVGPGGIARFYNWVGSAHVIIDVTGWFETWLHQNGGRGRVRG